MFLSSLKEVIDIILIIAVLGLCVIILEKYIVKDEFIRFIIRAIIAFAAIVFLLHLIGLY